MSESIPLARVLIVDDDPMQRMILKQSLQGEPYTLYEAEDGEQALKLFAQHRADLVILDVDMPKYNGFEVCQMIRAQPEGLHTAILVTTGQDDDESIDKAYEVGATDFLSKPINWTILRHRIKYIIRASSVLRRLHKLQSKNVALINALPDLVISFDPTDSVELPSLNYYQTDDSQTADKVEIPTHVKKKFLEYSQTFEKSKPLVSFEFEQPYKNDVKSFEVRMVKESEKLTIAIIRDITDYKRFERQLWQYAYFDELTKLPNRQQFNEKLMSAVEEVRTNSRQLALLMIDLDRFKKINDTFGHSVGDKLLQYLGRSINAILLDFVRQIGLHDDDYVFSRFGGDEFIAFIHGKIGKPDLNRLCKIIIQFFGSSIEINKKNFYITPSIGLSLYPDDGQTPEELIKHADIAMYYAKQYGRNTYFFYSHHMSADHIGRIELENSIREAIEQNQFILHYQPLIDLSNMQVHGVEALIRWVHPGQGIIGPMAFIGLAEEIGVLDIITDFVLEESCRQYQAWAKEGMRLPNISVNLSPSTLKDKSLMTKLVDLMARYQIPPNVLTIELTEGIFLDHNEATLELLESISAMGILISIDDFGTGYSSLNYLKHFPVHHLKIDKSFVQNITDSKSDLMIVDAIISMAHALNFSVIAEGVELKEQEVFLHKLNCDFAQGFFYAKPIPPELVLAHYQQQIKKQS